MAHPPLQTSVPRRTGNHHDNLWSDCFIQSLSSPYSAPSYSERRETLIEEIKDMVKPAASNVLERFWTVDVIQCLGIGRHFEQQTKLMLDDCYEYWKEEGTTLDLNTTALGFRTLRQNGYDVSADVFNIFKDENGQFFCRVATKEPHSELRRMLNLHRASEIKFPGETILKEANVFTCKYLQNALNEWKKSELEKNQLMMEVEYALKYPWRYSVPRWEARNYIEIFIQDNTYSMKDGRFNQKLLELAALDFNILQSLHQSELKQVSSWWKDSSVSNVDFFRHRHVEYFFWGTCGLFEEDFAACRNGFTKINTMFTYLDDIYDTYGTLDELQPFTTALISRDKSAIDNLPDYMKVTFKFVLETFVDIEKEMEKKHGHNPDVLKYIQVLWKDYILCYFNDAKWIASKYTPPLDVFLEHGPTSTGIYCLTMYSLLLMDTTFSDKIFKELNFPSLKLHSLTPKIGRFVDDIHDFQDENDHGENISVIHCFKRDNPESTYEDAFNYANNLLECFTEDFTREFFKPSFVPISYKNFYVNIIARGIFFLYKDGDGVSIANKEMKDSIYKILIESIPM